MTDIFAAENRQFLFDQVYRSFETTGSTALMVNIVLITLALILASLSVYFAVNHIKNKRHTKKLYFGEITDGEVVSSIVDQAMAQRSKVVCSFGKKNRPFDCAIYRADGNDIVLEPPYYVQPTSKWINRELECNFRIGLDKKNFLFYTFVSPVKGIEVLQGARMLRLVFPLSLFLGQKRRHLRLEPPLKWVNGLALWPAVSAAGAGEFESGMEKWGKPFIRMQKTEGSPLKVGLSDISAGGVRIRLSSEYSSMMEKMRQSNPYLFVYIALTDENNRLARYLLAARIRYSYIEEGQSFFSVSLEFIRHGSIKDKKKKIVDWKEINPEFGVEDLGNWVFKRHLQLYREKGLG
ncbi:MAG: hypothetical protein ACQES5_04995 [Thermodesulfobacteriota bacterium]